jgi:hypothetical protein
MTDNKDKKPSPVTTAILDGVCETLGVYRRVDAKEVQYDYTWLLSPLAKSRDSLTSTAQDPLLKVLAALLQLEPPVKPKSDGTVVAPTLPCFFRVHKDVPLGLAVRKAGDKFTRTVGDKQQDFSALGVDVVAMLPNNASLDPNRAALTPPRPPPTLLARARLARLITGGKIAELEQPVTLGLELHLAHKPADNKPPELRPFTALALEVGVDDKAEVSLVVTDATALTAKDDAAEAARRAVTWKRGDSLVRPLVHAGLVLLRAMIVWLAEKHRQAKPDHAAVRVRDHLFPLVEGFSFANVPALKPFPLAVFQRDFVALRDWLKSFLNPLVAMTVLGHLRALVSGKQDDKTAPGSAIAWMTDRTADAADYTAPNPRDFGLVVRTTGDELRGSAALGLRGQASWRFGDAVRIGLALEGELVRASWDLQFEIDGKPRASAKARASTGSANVFLVIEGIAGVTLCDTAHGNLASVGALARLELGASLSTAGLLPELRATFRTTGTDGKPLDVARSLGALLHELREAAEAQLQAVAAAVEAEAQAAVAAAWAAIAPLIAELKAVVVQLEQAVSALVATLADVLPAPVRTALVALLADVRARIEARLVSKDLAGLPAGLVDPAKLRGLVAAAITWTRTELTKHLPAVPDTLDLDLGLATLQLAANLDPNDPGAASFGATLTPKLDRFTAGLPVRLSPGTSIGVSQSGLTFVAGLELAPIDGLPWTPGVKFSLDTNTSAPRIDVDLRPPAANALPFSLPVLGGTPIAALEQVGDLAQKLVRPLITEALAGVSLVPGLSALDLLEIAGFSASSFAPPEPAAAAKALLQKIGPYAGTLAQGVASSVGLTFDPNTLTIAANNLSLGDAGVSAGIGSIRVKLLNDGKLAPSVALDDITLSLVGQDAPAFDAGFVSVGTLTAKASADVVAPKLRKVGLELRDVRLPLGLGGNGKDGKGEAGLLSTGKDNPGIHLDLGWEDPVGFYARFPSGAPKLELPIDRVIGPLDVKRLTATLQPQPPRPPKLKLGLDAIFKLGGVTIAPQGLGVAIPLDKLGEPGEWEPTLDGLGLAFDQAGITLAGMLARTDTGFVGQATIKAYQFQLGALAAYDKIAPDDVASLAVFGVLRMTLGGPPFFVVTGVAAGFGVNRSFARPRKTEALKDNPLLVTMQGNAPLDLAGFRAKLPAKVGAFWLAGGVKFVSYGFILGDALLYILLDDGFELGVLALARMGIPELLQINLAIEAGVSFRGEPTLYAKAALYDSWLLHKDCKITGGFALQVWPREGDAVVTIGGYHPAFKRPERYPEVERLGFRWALGDTIVIKGGCYFAMTPREAMGGGRLEVEGRWGPLSAGFYAGVDGLIRWDPFYFDVNIEVGVWGAIDLWFGKLRFSLGVGLHIWGPPIGGRAKLDLGVFSIDIPFGDPAPIERPALSVARYLRDHLHIALPPGTGDTAGSVHWPAQQLAVTGGDAKRPLRLAILHGRAPDLPLPNNAPPTLRLRSESVLRLDLAIPATEAFLNAFPDPPDPNAPPLFFTLANKRVVQSALAVFTPKARGKLHLLADLRPLALFGPHDVAAGVSGEMTTPVGAAALIDLTADLTNRRLVTSLGAEYSLPGEYAPPPARARRQPLPRRRQRQAGPQRPLDARRIAAQGPAVAARLARSGTVLPRVRVGTTGLAEVKQAGLYRDRVMHHRRARLAPYAVERPPQVPRARLPRPPARRLRAHPPHQRPAAARRPPARRPADRRPALPAARRPRAAPRRDRDPQLAAAAGRLAAPAHAHQRRQARARCRAARGSCSPRLSRPRRARPRLAQEDAAVDLRRPARGRGVRPRPRPRRRPPAARVSSEPQRRPAPPRRRLRRHRARPRRPRARAPATTASRSRPGARRLALIGLGGDRPVPAPAVLDSEPQWDGEHQWDGENNWDADVVRPLGRDDLRSGRDAPLPSEPDLRRDPDLRHDRPRFVRGFSGDTVLVGVAPRVFLVPGGVLEPRGGEVAQRDPLGRWPAAALLARVPELRLRLPLREAGVVALHLGRVTRELHTLRKVQCLADGEGLALGGLLVRGDAAVLWWVCRGASVLDLALGPHRAVGLSFWPDRSAPPDDVMDRTLHHPRASARRIDALHPRGHAMIPAPEPVPAPPLPPGQLATIDAAVPPLHPGVYPDLTIAQQVTGADAILASVTGSAVTLTVVDPGVAPLPADEILAVYPPAGAEDAADVMLPHVALRARSLPWANPPLAGATTWLALLLLRKGEATFDDLPDGRRTVTCTQGQLATLLPTKHELGLLCHVRELPSDDPLAARDDDRFVALVVGNRLPAASSEHDACLVDLRGLDAAPIWPGSPVSDATKVLPLLHRWSFKTGSGGDFEAHFARLRCPDPPDNPTGGVLAFGQRVDGEDLADDDGALLLAAPLPDEPERRVRYAGPLVPLARALEHDPSESADAALGLADDGTEVVGLAAAVELGRLLATANPRVLAGLVSFRDHQLREDIDTILATEALPRPDVLGMPGFVSDWRDIFDDVDPWFDGVRDDLWDRTGDPTGILGLVGKIPGLDTTRLNALGGFQLERRLTTMSGPLAAPGPAVTAASAPSLTGINLGASDLADLLHNQFGALRASVATIGIDLDEELAP